MNNVNCLENLFFSHSFSYKFYLDDDVGASSVAAALLCQQETNDNITRIILKFHKVSALSSVRFLWP